MAELVAMASRPGAPPFLREDLIHLFTNLNQSRYESPYPIDPAQFVPLLKDRSEPFDLRSAVVSLFNSIGGGSFLAFFRLNAISREGFLDSNDNLQKDTSEPFYDRNGNGVFDDPIGPVPGDPQSGSLIAEFIENASTISNINPKIILVMAQREQSLISASSIPSVTRMSVAFGCNPATPTDFRNQLYCAAETLRRRYDQGDTRLLPGQTRIAPEHAPFFFRLENQRKQTLPTGQRRTVAFRVAERADFVLYIYNQFIQEQANGGGNLLFEQLWSQYGF